MRSRDHSALINRVDVSHYKIPTDFPESDGTLKWDHTSLTIVVVSAGGAQGVGYTYAGSETAALIHEVLAGAIKGEDAMSPPAVYRSMWQKIRNIGQPWSLLHGNLGRRLRGLGPESAHPRRALGKPL